MSHVTACSVEIRDLDELRRACEALGLVFCEGQKHYAWYGRWYNDFHAQEAAVTQGFNPKDFGKSEHAIKVPGCKYEVGVVKRVDGKGYTLLYDNIGEGTKIANRLGKGCEKLVQRYAANTATKSLRKKGYKVVERVATNGNIVLQTL